MAKKDIDIMEKSWKTLEITQDCSFGWTLENVAKFITDCSFIKDYAYILHDKDLKEADGSPRDPHIHLALRFSSPTKTRTILKRFETLGLVDVIKVNQLQKCKSWSALLNYLTHRDEHKWYKHVYDVSDVISNFDWQLEAETAHEQKSLRVDKSFAKELVQKVASGDLKEYQIVNMLDPWEFALYESYIRSAKKYARLKNERKGTRNMEVIFVTGGSGFGKDTFAVDWCRRKGLEYFRTNNNDVYPFDNYRGEPVVIWSDARDDVFKPNQLFALLDNHWNAAQKARFADITLDCRYMLITSVKPITEWYKSAFENASEPARQLYRRVRTWVRLDYNEITVSIYDQSAGFYIPSKSFPNTFRHDESMLDTLGKRLCFVDDLFGEYYNIW